MLEWIQNLQPDLWWLFALSIVTFFGTLIAVPMLLVRIPHDYFTHERRESYKKNNHNILFKTIFVLLKNALGCILIAMGTIMLITPGQGIITILVGLMLLNYPGKYRLERWLVSRPAVFRTINWLRRRTGRTELVL